MAGKKGEGPVTAALFDVDGTLVDTNYLHTVTCWEAFAQAGYEVPMADIHRAIGMGSGQMLDKLLPEARHQDSDPNVRMAHSTLSATCRSRLRPLRGAADLLRACKRRGLAVVLASSAELSGGVSSDELTSAGAAEIYRGPGDLLAALADSLLGTKHGCGGGDAVQLAAADRTPWRGTV